jgi:hypothetical protein
MKQEFVAGDSPFGPKSSGVYSAPEDTQALAAAAEAAGLEWHELNLGRVGNKREFLGACAKGLRFHRSFGGNWDALADCLKDLGADLVASFRNCEPFAEAAPDDYATALEVFQDAADFWRERGSTFVALFDVEPEGGKMPRFRLQKQSDA